MLALRRRKSVALEVLRIAATPHPFDDDCGDIAPKLGTIFKTELERASNDGRLAKHMFNFLWALFSMAKLDTQEIEGINGLLKRCIDLAPHISPDLLSARMTSKKHLQVNHNSAQLREDLVTQCIEAHKETKAAHDLRYRRGGQTRTYWNRGFSSPGVAGNRAGCEAGPGSSTDFVWALPLQNPTGWMPRSRRA